MQKVKNFALLITACAVLAGCVPESVVNNNSDVQSMKEEATVKTYGMEEISKHAVGEDCWLLIDGKVYDVTEFIASGRHPGGEAILAGCGIDATELFGTKAGSGNTHSENARKMLENYYIGDLAK